MTRFSPFGFELEQKDIFENPKSVLLGYRNSLVTGFGQNAGSEELGFEGFEEYSRGMTVDRNTLGGGNIDFVTETVVETREQHCELLDVFVAHDEIIDLGPLGPWIDPTEIEFPGSSDNRGPRVHPHRSADSEGRNVSANSALLALLDRLEDENLSVEFFPDATNLPPICPEITGASIESIGMTADRGVFLVIEGIT